MSSLSFFNLKNVLLFIILCDLMIHINTSISFMYPFSISLSNGNIFIIHKLGISVCDPLLSKIIKNITIFTEEEQLKEETLSRVTSIYENGFIFNIINDKIYIVNESEILLYESNTTILNGENPGYYSLVPIKKVNEYYYYIISFAYNNLLFFLYYKFNILSNKNIFIYSKKNYQFKYDFEIANDDYNIENNALSCQFVNHIINGESLSCFFTINKDMQLFMVISFFKVGNNEITQKPKSFIFEFNYKITCIKTSINTDHSKILTVFYSPDVIFGLFLYDTYIVQYETIEQIYYQTQKCKDKFYGLNINYFKEKNEFIFSCLYYNNTGVFVDYYQLEDNFTDSDIEDENWPEIIKFFGCESINCHSILYFNNKKKYYILSDVKCNGKNYFVQPLYDENIIEEIENETDELAIDNPESDIEKIEDTTDELTIDNPESDIEKIEDTIDELTIDNLESDENDNNQKKEKEIIKEDICGLEKCQSCNEESKLKDLCIVCNNIKGFYFLNNQLSITKKMLIYGNYIDCVNNITKPSNFYFNKENNDYEPCFYTCGTCNYGGNKNENNCTSCGFNYIKEPYLINSSNCVLKCSYYYYYTSYGEYKCTSFSQCPKDYNLLIYEKKKCVKNCMEDDIYKYQYNGECLKECPVNTTYNIKDYICKDININKCLLRENNYTFMEEIVSESEIKVFAKNYAKEYQYTDNHVSIFKNNIYSIIIYKNPECISELSLDNPQIDFGECQEKLKHNYNIDKNMLVIILTKKMENLNYKKMISFFLFNPDSGEMLKENDICNDEILIVKENLLIKMNNSKEKFDSLSNLTKQNINIFNLSSRFYTDICYHFDSPVNKDITLKDRILSYYPNITLCENGCHINRINLTSFRAECKCKLDKLRNNSLLMNSQYIQNRLSELEDIMTQTNIEIIKCYEDIIDSKYLFSCIGGYIIAFLIIIQLIMTIIYFGKSISLIQKYLLKKINKYIIYLSIKKGNVLINNDNFLNLHLQENIYNKYNIIDLQKKNNPKRARNMNKKKTNGIYDNKKKKKSMKI